MSKLSYWTDEMLKDASIIVYSLIDRLNERKTFEQYTRQLRQYARDYYNGKLDDTGFLDKMIAAVQNQFNRAWNDGMTDNGLDPRTDKTQAMRDRIAGLVENEQNFITNLADLINGQREKQAGLDAIYSRVDVWSSNYNGVREISKVETSRKRKKWILGPTEQHCPSCSKLDGLVKPAQEWAERGVYPQVNGADYLNCHGYNCLCELVDTDEPVSERDFPDLP